MAAILLVALALVANVGVARSDAGQPPDRVPAPAVPLSTAGSVAQPRAGSTVFVADAERPLPQELQGQSCVTVGRARQVARPVAQGIRAYRFELRDGDVPSGSDERCEFGVGNGEPIEGTTVDALTNLLYRGQERWIAAQIYVDEFNPYSTEFQNLIQYGKHPGRGPSTLNLRLQEGKWMLTGAASSVRYASASEATYWSARWDERTNRRRWLKFLLHVRFSPRREAGFVEFFGDLDGRGMRLLKPRTHAYTMKVDRRSRTIPVSPRFGIYRNGKVRGTYVVGYDGYTIAADRASAEAVAFGR
jgi:hypothetical protein